MNVPPWMIEFVWITCPAAYVVMCSLRREDKVISTKTVVYRTSTVPPTSDIGWAVIRFCLSELRITGEAEIVWSIGDDQNGEYKVR